MNLKFKKNVIPDTLTPIQNLLCGFAGVAIPRTILFPIDTMKLIASNNDGQLLPALTTRVCELGIPSLWNGIICDWIRLPPQFILRYFITQTLRSCPYRIPGILEDTISSAGAVAAIHPIEVVHNLMQYDPHKYSTLPKTIAHIFKTDGVSGFFRGLSPTVLGFIPYRTVQYCSFALFDKISRDPRVNAQPSYYKELCLSVLISTAAQASSYPFEVIRKRMMSDPRVHDMSFTEIVRDTYHRRGIRGFYDAFGITMMRVFPIIWMQQMATKELRKFVALFNYEMAKHKFD